MPCRFARQFGYDQLYAGKPNPNLRFCGNLFKGVRAWYYNIAGGTSAVFTLPHKKPNSYASLGFCMWYFMANKVPGFGINTSCIKDIKSAYKAKEGSKGCWMRGMTEYQEVEKDAKKEARKETSKVGAALVLEFGEGAAEEQRARRTRQAMPKRSRASASQSEPRQKKARKRSEATVSVQMPEILPYGMEE